MSRDGLPLVNMWLVVALALKYFKVAIWVKKTSLSNSEVLRNQILPISVEYYVKNLSK